MRLVVIFAIFCLTACQQPVYRASADLSPEYAACLRQAANVDPAVNDCNGAEYERQNAALNAAYVRTAKALDAIDPGQKARLVEAQRRWTAWRDAECGWRRVGDGALGRQMEVQCLIRLTRERTDGLAVSVLQRGN